MIAAAVFVILPLCLAIAAFSDLFTMTIPNRVSLILIASFAVIAPFSGLGWDVIGMHFAGAAIVFSVCFALFALNVMGGGDAKLLSATALWFGFNQSLLFLMADVGLIGGLLTLLDPAGQIAIEHHSRHRPAVAEFAPARQENTLWYRHRDRRLSGLSVFAAVHRRAGKPEMTAF